jgi:hypothetical protein
MWLAIAAHLPLGLDLPPCAILLSFSHAPAFTARLTRVSRACAVFSLFQDGADLGLPFTARAPACLARLSARLLLLQLRQEFAGSPLIPRLRDERSLLLCGRPLGSARVTVRPSAAWSVSLPQPPSRRVVIAGRSLSLCFAPSLLFTVVCFLRFEGCREALGADALLEGAAAAHAAVGGSRVTVRIGPLAAADAAPSETRLTALPFAAPALLVLCRALTATFLPSPAAEEFPEAFAVFWRHAILGMAEMRRVFAGPAWTIGPLTFGQSLMLVYQHRVSINLHWRPLSCCSAIVPSAGPLRLLQVPLAAFKKFSYPIRPFYFVHKVEMPELSRFRDAIVDFYDDFAMLIRVGFPPPSVEDVRDGEVTFRGDFEWQVTAVIEADGIELQAEALPLLSKVSQRFKQMFAVDRRLLRRAGQFLSGLAKLELNFVTVICEVIEEFQREKWAREIDWEGFFNGAKVSTDGTRIAVAVWTNVDALNLEASRVEQKLQITAATRVGSRAFFTVRGFVQWLTESDPGRRWAI